MVVRPPLVVIAGKSSGYLVVLGLGLALVLVGGGGLGRGGRGRDAEAAKRAAKARMGHGGTKLRAERRERRLAGRSGCGRDETVTFKSKRNVNVNETQNETKQNSNKKEKLQDPRRGQHIPAKLTLSGSWAVKRCWTMSTSLLQMAYMRAVLPRLSCALTSHASLLAVWDRSAVTNAGRLSLAAWMIGRVFSAILPSASVAALILPSAPLVALPLALASILAFFASIACARRIPADVSTHDATAPSPRKGRESTFWAAWWTGLG